MKQSIKRVCISKSIKLLFAFLLVGLISCNNNSKKPKKWQATPPIKGGEIQFTEFTVNTEKDTILEMPSGTKINVPANAFINKQTGEKVQGEVKLKYREFHNAVDIMLSGIPMNIKVMGEDKTFETAGMFELAGEQNGAEVEITKGKNINVELASQYEGTDYDFFYFDKNAGGEWQWAGYPETKVNTKKIESQRKLDSTIITDKVINDIYFTLNYDVLMDWMLGNNNDKINKYAKSPKSKSRLAEYNIRSYNINISLFMYYGSIRYYPSEILWENVELKTIPKEFQNFKSNIKYKHPAVRIPLNCNFKRIKGNLYEMTMYKGKNKFTMKIKAVFPLKNLFKRSAKNWKQEFAEIIQDTKNDEKIYLKKIEEYKKKIEEYKKEQEKINKMAKTVRSFSVPQMGIYNFDRCLTNENWLAINPKFVINSEINDKEIIFNKPSMLIFEDNSGFINLSSSRSYDFKINPNTNFTIVIIDDKKKNFYFYKNNNKQPIVIKESVYKKIPEVKIELKTQTFTDADDFRKKLGLKEI